MVSADALTCTIPSLRKPSHLLKHVCRPVLLLTRRLMLLSTSTCAFSHQYWLMTLHQRFHCHHIGRPSILCSFETPNTRTPKYKLPQLNLTFGHRAFSYAGPAAWNCLPQSLQSLVNTGKFKRHLKAHFFARVFASYCL